MDELLQQIRSLPNDRAMEAAKFLAGEDVPPGRPQKLIEQIAAQAPDTSAEVLHRELNNATPDQVAELARALLVFAALSDREEDVRLAIEGAGRRFLVIEIVAVGALALAAYQMWRTRGARKIRRTVEVTVKPDGTMVIRKDEVEEFFSIGEILGSAVQAASGGQ